MFQLKKRVVVSALKVLKQYDQNEISSALLRILSWQYIPLGALSRCEFTIRSHSRLSSFHWYFIFTVISMFWKHSWWHSQNICIMVRHLWSRGNKCVFLLKPGMLFLSFILYRCNSKMKFEIKKQAVRQCCHLISTFEIASWCD